MKIYFLVFITNFIFQLLRTASVYAVVNKSVIMTGVFAIAIQLTWILSVGLGISEGIVKGDLFAIFMFVLGGTLGAIVSVWLRKKV